MPTRLPVRKRYLAALYDGLPSPPLFCNPISPPLPCLMLKQVRHRGAGTVHPETNQLFDEQVRGSSTRRLDIVQRSEAERSSSREEHAVATKAGTVVR